MEVPRETRLEKMHGGKAEWSTKIIFGVHFRSKSQMDKNKVAAQVGGSRLSCGSYLDGVIIIMTFRVWDQ